MTLFVGRQPILDRVQNTYGYELLFRDGLENIFNADDADHASLAVINTSMGQMGMHQITGGKKAFINFTRKLLVEDYGNLLPQEQVVIEVLENIAPDDDVIEACQRLKNAGYTVALDDFQYTPAHEPLVQLADLIKVDLSVSDEEEQLDYAKKFIPMNIRLLAERVETIEDFLRTKEMGYSLFQGYFFSKPVVLSAEKAPESKLARLKLLQVVNQPEFDIQQAESIIKHDPTLTMKLFRYINSSFFGLSKEVYSIRHALTLLGEMNIRKWSTVLLISSIAEDKPNELLRQAIVRGSLCEQIATSVGLAESSQELFVTGIFSLLDTMMNQTMSDLLEDMPLSKNIKAALLGGKSPYNDILAMGMACEVGDWKLLSRVIQQYAILEEQLAVFQTEAFLWADEIATS